MLQPEIPVLHAVADQEIATGTAMVVAWPLVSGSATGAVTEGAVSVFTVNSYTAGELARPVAGSVAVNLKV